VVQPQPLLGVLANPASTTLVIAGMVPGMSILPSASRTGGASSAK
jgi:hypothetical protein